MERKNWNLSQGYQNDKKRIEQLTKTLLRKVGIQEQKTHLNEQDIELIVRHMQDSCYRIKYPRHEFRKSSKEFSNEVIEILDKDKDGRVSIEEFNDYFNDRLSGNLASSFSYLPDCGFNPVNSSLFQYKGNCDLKRSSNFNSGSYYNTGIENKENQQGRYKNRQFSYIFEKSNGKNSNEENINEKNVQGIGNNSRECSLRKTIKLDSEVKNMNLLERRKSNSQSRIENFTMKPFTSFSQCFNNENSKNFNTSRSKESVLKEYSFKAKNTSINKDDDYVLKENFNTTNIEKNRVKYHPGKLNFDNLEKPKQLPLQPIEEKIHKWSGYKRNSQQPTKTYLFKEDNSNKEFNILDNSNPISRTMDDKENPMRLSTFKKHNIQINLNLMPHSDDSDIEMASASKSQKSGISRNKYVSFQEKPIGSAECSPTSLEKYKKKFEVSNFDLSLSKKNQSNSDIYGSGQKIDVNFNEEIKNNIKISPEYNKFSTEKNFISTKTSPEKFKPWVQNPLRKSHYVRDYSNENDYNSFNLQQRNSSLKKNTEKNFRVNYGHRDAKKSNIIERKSRAKSSNVKPTSREYGYSRRKNSRMKRSYVPYGSRLKKDNYRSEKWEFKKSLKKDLSNSCYVKDDENGVKDYYKFARLGN